LEAAGLAECQEAFDESVAVIGLQV